MISAHNSSTRPPCRTCPDRKLRPSCISGHFPQTGQIPSCCSHSPQSLFPTPPYSPCSMVIFIIHKTKPPKAPRLTPPSAPCGDVSVWNGARLSPPPLPHFPRGLCPGGETCPAWRCRSHASQLLFLLFPFNRFISLIFLSPVAGLHLDYTLF